jgi:[ribosomal protein S18]-alanine N-acetyltransferase
MTSPLITFRAMADADVLPVLEIERASSSQPWTERIFHDELGQGDGRRYVVALANDEVVGFCGLLFQLDEAHVTNVAVAPSHRRRGIAERLVLDAVRAAIARSVVDLTLEVRVSNQAAIALYHRFGFAPEGIRRAYYPDNREDALVMWAHDIDTSAYGLRLARIAERLDRFAIGQSFATSAADAVEASS